VQRYASGAAPLSAFVCTAAHDCVRRLRRLLAESQVAQGKGDRRPRNADESQTPSPPRPIGCGGPDFANSSRFHSAPFQRRPVNRSTGPRFHSAPFHRPESSKTGCPGAVSAGAFAKSLQPTSRASGPCQNSRPHVAPKSVRPLPLRARRWPDACPPPARRRPPSHPAVRSRRNAAPRPGKGRQP
jgi:hypothetical protein